MAGNSGNPIDTNLIPSNIKNGVNIFGVVGNYTGIPGLFFGAGSKVGIVASVSDFANEDVRSRDWLFESTNHIYIWAVYNIADVPMDLTARAGIMVINKNTGEVKIAQDIYNGGFGGGDWNNPNQISYDDSTGDFYYAFENTGNYIRKFDFATATWSTVAALVGTTASTTFHGQISPGASNVMGNITYGGVTYTVNIDCFNVDATNRQAAYIYLTIS